MKGNPPPLRFPTRPNRDSLDPLADLKRIHPGHVDVHVDRRRYGKDVTVLTGFAAERDLRPVARHLKRRLAVGGSVKGRCIELQGDHRTRIAAVVAELGIHATLR